MSQRQEGGTFWHWAERALLGFVAFSFLFQVTSQAWPGAAVVAILGLVLLWGFSLDKDGPAGELARSLAGSMTGRVAAWVIFLALVGLTGLLTFVPGSWEWPV